MYFKRITILLIFLLYWGFSFGKVININTYKLPNKDIIKLKNINNKVYNRLFLLSNKIYGKKISVYISKLESINKKIDYYLSQQKTVPVSVNKSELDKFIFKLRLYFNIEELIKLILLKEKVLNKFGGGVYCQGVSRKVCFYFKKIYEDTIRQIYSNGYLTNFDVSILKKIPIYLKLVDKDFREKGKFFSRQRRITLEGVEYKISYPEKVEFYLTKEDIDGISRNNFDYIHFWKNVIAHEIGHYVEEIKLLNKKKKFDVICRSGSLLKCGKFDFIPTTNWFLIRYVGQKVIVGTGKEGDKIYTYYKIYPSKFDYYSMTAPEEDFAETFAYESYVKKYSNYFSSMYKKVLSKLSSKYRKKAIFILKSK